MFERALILLPALVLGVEIPAWAQDPKPAVPPKPDERVVPQARAWVHEAEDLIGAPVKDRQKNEEIGEIDDLLFDTKTGECRYAVIGLGGVLGVGEGHHAVPIDLFHFESKLDGDDEKVCYRLDFDREKLKGAPKLPDDINAPANASWEAGVRQYFGVQGSVAGDASRMGGLLLGAKQIQGMDLHGADGKEIGSIGELVLDSDSCRITCFALETGGFLGLGEKVFALPWDVVKVARDGDGDPRLTTLVDEGKLSSAPEYDAKNILDRSWMQRVYAFYSVRPYWSNAREAGQDKGPQGDGSRKPGQNAGGR